MRKTADAAALEKVTAAVNAQESAVRAQVQAVVRNRVLEAVLQTLHPPITVEQFAQAPKEVQAAVNAAVDQQMGTDAIKDQVGYRRPAANPAADRGYYEKRRGAGSN